MNQPYSIRFPMKKESTGRRTGKRYRLVVDKTGLFGARSCAASMINSALIDREAAKDDLRMGAMNFVRFHRLGMRLDALWARVFAGQIDQHDPRLDAVSAERTAIAASWSANQSAA